MKRKMYLVVLFNALAFAFLVAAVSADSKPEGLLGSAPLSGHEWSESTTPKTGGQGSTPAPPSGRVGAAPQAPEAPEAAVGSGFTYQGRLKDGNSPANGSYDLQFTLYDASSGGNVAGGPITLLNQTVTDGLFTVQLDFGSSAIQGSARWLEIAVRQAGGGTYTTLSPRQPLTPAPYAMSLMPGAVITGTLDASPVISVTNAGTGGTGVYGNAPTGFGLYGTSQSIGGVGVYGYNPSNIGVYGVGGYGLYGSGLGSGSYGVYGSSSGSSSYGVYGTATYGVGGNSTSDYGAGVTGTASGNFSDGVSGFGTGAGVHGVGSFGVEGDTANANGYGVYGSNSGVGGAGIYGTGSTGVYANGTTYGVYGTNSAANGIGMYGQGLTSSSTGVKGLAGHIGVEGDANDGAGSGVYGSDAAASGIGVSGVDTVTDGIGVKGNGNAYGVYGITGYQYGFGVYGANASTNGTAVYGVADHTGVYGTASNTGVQGYAPNYGVYGSTVSASGVGVGGNSQGTGGTGVSGSAASGFGVYGSGGGIGGVGVYGLNNANIGVYGVGSYGVYGQGSPWAGYFSGNVRITGTCCNSPGLQTQIDDPQDPANKYLNQAPMESQDMLDVLSGNVTTDAQGNATISLPAYFEATNRDFRYQMTIVGDQFAQVRVSSKIDDNRFSVQTDKPDIDVSWQVTGVRDDPYARAHPLTPEQDKPSNERGYYLNPELYGQPASKGVDTIHSVAPPNTPPTPAADVSAQPTQPGGK